PRPRNAYSRSCSAPHCFSPTRRRAAARLLLRFAPGKFLTRYCLPSTVDQVVGGIDESNH
uniref:Uncharacterized protein n=1 Tax=Aegilops tauschii subsp. strangulata TaxID=200361 RepID=A0A453NN31_AEGTS